MSESESAARSTLAEFPITLRWRDQDAFNHVNNSTFLTYLEEARLHWLNTCAAGWDKAAAMPVMAAVTLNYRRQLTWPGEIVVQLFCARVGTSSLTVAHRIVDARDTSIIYNDGSVVMVWIDPSSGKPAALPELIRNACR
jgi:acyl-CoA thioester hydrolase